MKVPLYARHGVPETWIVDLQNRRILFYRSPSGGEYRSETSTDAPGSTAIAALPDVMLDLSRLLL